MNYREVRLDQLREPDWSWHYDDETLAHKIDGSLTLHGQLRAIVVRQVDAITLPHPEIDGVLRVIDDALEIVDGRQIYRALLRAGKDTAFVADLGPISREEAILAALSLELRHEIDYVKLGREVTALVSSQGSGFSAVVPFTGVDLAYYVTLSSGFDWSQFYEEDLQEGLFADEMAEMSLVEPISADSPPIEIIQSPTLVSAPPSATTTSRSLNLAKPSATALLPTGPSALSFAWVSSPTPEVVPPEVVPSEVAASEVSAEPDPVSALVDDLLRRGHRVLTNEDKLFLTNPSSLTDADRAAIKEHKSALLLRAAQCTWVEEKPTSLAAFLGSMQEPLNDWQPSAPLQLDNIDTLEIDTETNGLEWHKGDRPIGISICLPDGRTQYLPWGHAGGNLDEAVVKRWAERELRGKRLTGANIRFDVHMLREWGVDLEAQGCVVSDVMHYAALLDDNRRKFNLDDLASDYLGKHKTGQNLDKTRMASYHASEVASYAETDALLVQELRKVMWPLMDEQELQTVRQLEDDVIFTVCEMEKNGAPIDRVMLKQWCAETKAVQEEAMFKVAKEVGFSMNPDAPEDWEALFNHFNIPVTHFTEGGRPSFADSALKHIDHLYIQLARRAGKIASLRSKFLDSYDIAVGDDSLLRYSLHQLRGNEYGTVRGRFSASDKNIQQVMNHTTHMTSFESEDYFVRRLFVPGNGLFLSADAKQIEYRIFGNHSGSAKILAAYAEDPTTSYHMLVQNLVKPFKNITYERAKALNFMKIYGGGKERMAQMLELPRQESDQIARIYDDMFPEVPILLRKATSLAETRGYVKTVLGRRARFPDKKFAHKALNAVIQGSAADIMKRKLVELHHERKNTGFTMRYTVHDEVCGDVPDQEAARKVEEILNRQSFSMLKVPILWSVATGKHWAECK